MSIAKLMQLCMESSTGNRKPNVETEVAIYAKMTNQEGLKEASHVEHHEQLEGPSVDGGRFRCRKTTTGEDVKYVLTMKVKNPGDGIGGIQGSLEYDLEIDEAFYTAFKNLATKRLDKTRYIFHGEGTTLDKESSSDQEDVVLPPVKYEVDVFRKEDGTESEWVKIDVELDDVIAKLQEAGEDADETKLRIKVSHLPMSPVGGFIAKQATEEQKKILDDIWDNHFNLPVFIKNTS